MRSSWDQQHYNIMIAAHQPYDQHCDQQYDHHNANTTHQPDDQLQYQHFDQRWLNMWVNAW